MNLYPFSNQNNTNNQNYAAIPKLPQQVNPPNPQTVNSADKLRRQIGSKMEFDLEYSLASGQLIGEGAYGSVYRCRSSDDNIEWAVKIIEVPNREEYRNSSEREVIISLQMDQHPHIIAVKRIFTWTNEITHKYATAIVLELADSSLYSEFEAKQKAGKSFSEEEVLTYLSQCIDGLSFLYKRHGICHRDIKTENLLLKGNSIKITDFGVSKTIHEERMRSLQANTIAGTPLFLSPKVWDAYIKRSEYNVIHDLQKSDIFSLGLVFLQLALMLSNQQVAGLNQAEGEKKLQTFFNRIRSNKLRTIFAAMLAFDEDRRADYDALARLLAQSDQEFSKISHQSFLPPKQQQPLVQQQYTPMTLGILGTQLSQQQVPSQPLNLLGFNNNNNNQSNLLNYNQQQQQQQQQFVLKNMCYRHNKQIEFFCEYPDCFECLCSECNSTHSESHMERVMTYQSAMQKYVESNVLATNYATLNTQTIKEIKTKLNRYSNNFREEAQKASADLRRQLLQSLESALNRWTTDINNRLASVQRDTDLISISTRGDETQLLDSQAKVKANPISNVYLQMIARQQPIFESNIQRAKEKVAAVHSELVSLAKIESVYVNFLNALHPLTSSFSNSFESFFNSILSIEKEQQFIKNLQSTQPPIEQMQSDKQKPLDKLEDINNLKEQDNKETQKKIPNPIEISAPSLPVVVPQTQIVEQAEEDISANTNIENESENQLEQIQIPSKSQDSILNENISLEKGKSNSSGSSGNGAAKQATSKPKKSNGILQLKPLADVQNLQLTENSESTLLLPNTSAVSVPCTPRSNSTSILSPTREFASSPGGTFINLIFINVSNTKQLIVGSQSNGKIVKIIVSNEERSEVHLDSYKPSCALYAATQKKIIYGTESGNLFFFDPFTMKVVTEHSFKESQNSQITCMQFLEKKPHLLLAGSQDGQIILWDTHKRIQERLFNRLHVGRVTGVFTNAADSLMISIGSDNAIILAEIASSKIRFTKSNAHSAVDVDVVDSGEQNDSGDNNAMKQKQQQIAKEGIVALKKIKENSFLTAGVDGFVKLWEIYVNNNSNNGMQESSDGVILVGHVQVHAAPITVLEYYWKYDLIVTSASDGTLCFTDPKDYKQIAVTAQSSFLNGGALALHWEKVGCLYTADANSIKKWETQSFGKVMAAIKKRVKASNSNCSIF